MPESNGRSNSPQSWDSFLRFIDGRVKNTPHNYEPGVPKQKPAPPFIMQGARILWTVCRIHKRPLSYDEFELQKCFWCEPEVAPQYTANNKKNPCYNHDANRPYTKEEINALLKGKSRKNSND